jgi:ABC-type transport system substrate-binding protein
MTDHRTRKLHDDVREELTTGFSIHETATIATIWPASPCFSNLVIFDPFKPRETLEGIVGELAEKWSWFLRRDVKWYDGAPFTSKDVVDAFTHWPQVRNLVPHHGIYNWGRLTNVWLDK